MNGFWLVIIRKTGREGGGRNIWQITWDLTLKRALWGSSALHFTTRSAVMRCEITTHYNNRMDSSLFSVIHETGHTIYELGVSDELTQTLVGQGSIHRHAWVVITVLWRYHWPQRGILSSLYEKLQSIFPGEQLKGVSKGTICGSLINKAGRDIRTEGGWTPTVLTTVWNRKDDDEKIWI